jgi:hypothetical protein
MTNWLADDYLGLVGAALAVWAWEKLSGWWAEGKQDLKIGYVEQTDPIVERIRRTT